jgi:two-component system CheB/CheR fusion protein
MHGGEVEVHSAGVGKGSEFVVRLPVAVGADVAAVEAPVARPGPRIRRRILVVDDNRDQSRSLGMLLEVLGHEVALAFDGPSAVQTAIDFRPEIALLDIGIPGLSGYEVARRIRKTPGLEKTVLVAQTGWGQEQDRRNSAEAGFHHHLVKPVDIETVRQIIDSVTPPSPPTSRPATSPSSSGAAAGKNRQGSKRRKLPRGAAKLRKRR